MENESETENDASSFFNAIDRMQTDMKHLMEFAEKLKIKHETDDLLQDMSTNTKFATEISEGPLDPEQLAMLLKMVSEKSPGEVLSCLNNHTRDGVEKIKKQLQDIPTAIRDNAKNQKKMDDRLIKRIQKFLETVEKLRLQPTNRQSQLHEFFPSQSQEQMLLENS